MLPDLTILGKVVGGGLPLAAFGGRADVMELLAPAGAVYQAGTLSGNPLATAAGLSVLRRLRDPAVYAELERRAAASSRPPLAEAAAPVRRACSASARCSRSSPRTARCATSTAPHASDRERYGALFRGLLERGVYVAALAVRGLVRLARARRRGDRAALRRPSETSCS